MMLKYTTSYTPVQFNNFRTLSAFLWRHCGPSHPEWRPHGPIAIRTVHIVTAQRLRSAVCKGHRWYRLGSPRRWRVVGYRASRGLFDSQFTVFSSDIFSDGESTGDGWRFTCFSDPWRCGLGTCFPADGFLDRLTADTFFSSCVL